MARAASGLVGFALAVWLALLPWPAPAEDAPHIAAASDLQFALDEVAARFARETGRSVKLAYGSSGNFFRQIVEGAPFEMFLSADEDFVFRLAAQGFAADRGVPYAEGRLVLFAPQGSPLELDGEWADLARALADGRIRRFAIANPEHAPYGRAAREALIARGLWEAVRPRLVLGENVSQAARFAVSGSAQGGLFAYSLALAPALAGRGRHLLVPAAWHRPLRQRMVLTRGAGETARRFFAFVQGEPARAILARYGFTLPADR